MLEIGFRDEPNARVRPSVDVGVVYADAVGCPVGHAIVDVLTITDAHGGDTVLANTDVRSGIQTSSVDTRLNSKVEKLLRASLPRRPLPETRGLVTVPLPCSLLGSDVEIVSIGFKGIDLI